MTTKAGHVTTKSGRRATIRDRRLLLLYGITEREYRQVLGYQGDVCAGCGERRKQNRLSVDHRHSDGLLRGLICWSCNKALACARDNPATLLRLYGYLNDPPATRALGRETFGRPGRSTRKWRTKRERREAFARMARRLAELGYIKKHETR